MKKPIESALDQISGSAEYSRTRLNSTLESSLYTRLSKYRLDHRDKYHTMAALLDDMVLEFLEKKEKEVNSDVLL
jgi:hypothetical protein